MVGRYYLCKLPAEKQHYQRHTPKTEYYGIHCESNNGVYHVTGINKREPEELRKIRVAIMNYREFGGEAVAAEVPPRPELSRGRRFLDHHHQIMLDNLVYNYGNLEAFSQEELKTIGIEDLVEKPKQ